MRKMTGSSVILFMLFHCIVIAQHISIQNSSAAPTANNFTYPQSIFVDSESGHIWVTDFDNHRVMRFDVSGLTSVDENPAILPQRYHLDQNYPNPFNPETQIRFTLQVSGFTTIKIFDLLGKEVATLVHQIEEAGVHTVSFNAARLPSGIYFYTLRSGSFSETKRMVFIK